MKKLLKKYMTLKYRIPAIIIMSLLVLGCSIIGISFKRYEDLNVEKHVKMAEGITRLMADAFDADKMDYYIEHNYSDPEYMELLKYYYTIRESYLDVEYMYIYRLFRDEGDGTVKGQVIVDLDEEYTEDVPQESIDWIGELYTFNAGIMEDVERITEDKECIWEIGESEEDGKRLLTYCRPILDSEGNYVCSACVDFSMGAMIGKGITFVLELLAVIVVEFLVIIAMVNFLLSVILFNPIKKMTNCIKNFKFETDKDRYDSLSSMEALQIHLNNELDDLYDALVMSLKDSAYYMQNFERARGEIKEISETAYKDALTGVGSKTAYNNTIEQLQTGIDRHTVTGGFAIVMIDVNNLKYVNDTFGHEHGDDYIRGCCRIICETFKHSPVFRIGGDEFVVILKDADYDARVDLLAEIEDAFDTTYHDESLPAYARYSASYGMAVFDLDKDRSVEEIFKRADALMYEYKKAFKKVNGSYR
jgi:diguanylate cyclase (GGDEF)-like protein